MATLLTLYNLGKTRLCSNSYTPAEPIDISGIVDVITLGLSSNVLHDVLCDGEKAGRRAVVVVGAIQSSVVIITLAVRIVRHVIFRVEAVLNIFV